MRIVAESGPSNHRQAVVFCLNRAWLPFAAMAARQIALLPGKRDFDICLASVEPLVLPEELGSLGLRLLRIDVGDLLAGLHGPSQHPSETYLRLAMPDLLAENYDRILYLDSDVFVQGGDISALLSVDLGGRCVGAVRVVTQWGSPQRQRHEFAIMGLKPAPYFNAGVLLIDIIAYRKLDITRKALELGGAKGKLFKAHDQSLLNVCLHGAWAELSPAWNWQWFLKAPFFEALAGPNVVHMIGTTKPWHEPGRVCMSMLYQKAYASFLAAYFPEYPRVEPQIPYRMRTRFWWFLTGLRHVLRRARILRFLDRFPTETTVHLP